MYKCLSFLKMHFQGLLALCPRNILNWRYASGEIKLHPNRPVSCGQQKFDTDPSTYPLNEPISKIDALVKQFILFILVILMQINKNVVPVYTVGIKQCLLQFIWPSVFLTVNYVKAFYLFLLIPRG